MSRQAQDAKDYLTGEGDVAEFGRLGWDVAAALVFGRLRGGRRRRREAIRRRAAAQALHAQL